MNELQSKVLADLIALLETTRGTAFSEPISEATAVQMLRNLISDAQLVAAKASKYRALVKALAEDL